MMVNIHPVCREVSWPADEGVIGVVGVAPWATLEFCQRLYSLIQVVKDWEYPRIIADINCKIPSRGRHLQLGERDPSPFIEASINELAAQGATVAVVPCNTAHILFPRWASKTAIPALNIIDATLGELTRSDSCVVTFGSSSLMKSGLYQQYPPHHSCRFFLLNKDDQSIIDSIITAIKINNTIPIRLHKDLIRLVNKLVLQGLTTVILACTELTQLKQDHIFRGLNIIDSNEALARLALKAINFKKMKLPE